MYTERFDRALVYASTIHRDQVRKGSGIPYVTHLLAVASLVGEHRGTEEQVIGALLHDAIEDCIGQVPDVREQIATRFGDQVLQIVEDCTDADTIPKPPWRERKEAYIAHVRSRPSETPSLLVSLADKTHNARSILRDYRVVGDEIFDRFKGGRDGTLWYYAELADAFGPKEIGPLVDEFARVVAALQNSVHQ